MRALLRSFGPTIVCLFTLLSPLANAHTEPEPPASPVSSLSIKGGRVLDASGAPFVMRGANVMHAWFPRRSEQSLRDLASFGANTVRLVLANGDRWPKTTARQLTKLLRLCDELGLIAIVEIHDTTGLGEVPEATPLDRAVDYWIEMKPHLVGREDRVVINLGNEPLGNGHPEQKWVDISTSAVRRMRAAGFMHLLMVDAASWGQDWEHHSLRRAPEVFAADPLARTVFSVHMYDVFSTREKVESYLDTFAALGLPLVVGEFAADHGADKPIAVEAILKLCAQRGIGYLGWAWSGCSAPLESLDMVEAFDPRRPSPWGRLILEGPHGIRATARPAYPFSYRKANPTPRPGDPADR